jgi:hypothetical protein
MSKGGDTGDTGQTEREGTKAHRERGHRKGLGSMRTQARDVG